MLLLSVENSFNLELQFPVRRLTTRSFQLFVPSTNILFCKKLQNYPVINLKLLISDVTRNYYVRSLQIILQEI